MANFKYNEQQNIIPGQVTIHRGVLLRAVQKIPHTPCIVQCECHMPDFTEAHGCSGFCFRWDNGERIVFKKVEESELSELDCVLVETKFAKHCRTPRNHTA